MFNVESLNRSELQDILKSVRSEFTPTTEIKLNDKTDVLRYTLLGLLSDMGILDYVLCNYLPTSSLTAELAGIAKQLGLTKTLARVIKHNTSKLDPSIPKPQPVPTTEIKPKSSATGVKILKIDRKPAISARSLSHQFSTVGFRDQNDTWYGGQIATLILTDLWSYEGDRDNLAPSPSVKVSGYYTPAIVTIQPVTMEVDSGKTDEDGNAIYRQMPVYKPNLRTVIESNKVLLNSAVNGVSSRKLDLLPLISGNDTLLDNITSVEWFVSSPATKNRDQNKQVSTLRKNSVKSKPSWGTRFIKTELDPQASYGIVVRLPNLTGQFRLVLTNKGKINLYQDGVFFRCLGTWYSNYDYATNVLSVGGMYSKDNEVCPPEWYERITGAINKLIASEGKNTQAHLTSTMLSNLCQDSARQHGKAWSKAKFEDVKRKARKAVYSLYWAKPDPRYPGAPKQRDSRSALPFDVQRACSQLVEDEGLTPEQRAKLNQVIIGYALHAKLVRS